MVLPMHVFFSDGRLAWGRPPEVGTHSDGSAYPIFDAEASGCLGMGWWRGNGVRSVCAGLGLVVARFRTGTRLARLTTCFGVPAQDGNMRDRDETDDACAVRQRREGRGGDTLEELQLGETPEEAETRAQDEAAALAGMQAGRRCEK